MDQVTVPVGADKSKFRIIHPLTGDDIACTFDQSVINLDEVKKALPHRVAVSGRDQTRSIFWEGHFDRGFLTQATSRCGTICQRY